MSKTAALLLVLVFLTAPCTSVTMPVWVSADAVADSWVSKTPMQQARGGLGVAAVNGRIYAIGGTTESGQRIYTGGYLGNITGGVSSTNEEYNPEMDTWTLKSPMPTPRADFAIVAYENRIYCIGGRTNTSVTNVNEVYNPESNTWETKTSAPTARSGVTANIVNGKIYVIGGDPNGTRNEVYDPATNSWTTKTPLPEPPFNGYMSAALDGKIYAIGGLSQESNLNLIYDAESDKWSYGASPPTSVRFGAAVATTGVNAPKRIYVIGETSGLSEGEDKCFVRVYDPATNSWAFGTDIPTYRENLGIAVVNDILYAIGGTTHTVSVVSSFKPTKVNEQYTPIGYGTPEPAVQSPSPSPAPTQTEPTYGIAAAAAAITVITVTAVALKKRHSKSTG
jgi:N-acetylneuraminic acid mutarotase